MSLTAKQQFHKFLRESRTILILLPHQLQGDTLASAWALAHILEKQQKNVSVAADTLFRFQKSFAFLPTPKTTLETLSGARDFILAFNTKYNKIQALRSEQDDQEFRVYITPENGTVDPRDFSFIPAQFKYDLVIVLGAPDKESLGKLYEMNADIFYEVPVINIDHHAKNENYGQLNIINSIASSTSEVLTELVRETMPETINVIIAECLLTGIISATESFQKKNTTPKAFQTASWLMEQGADQQKIVLHLFKTQPLNILKLWGHVMSGLKWDEQSKCIWAQVTPEALLSSETDEEDLPIILEKIKILHSTAHICVLLFASRNSNEHKNTAVQCIIKCSTPEMLDAVIALFPGGELMGDTYVFTYTNQSIEAVEQDMLTRLHAL